LRLTPVAEDALYQVMSTSKYRSDLPALRAEGEAVPRTAGVVSVVVGTAVALGEEVDAG
jgi:hypothetical protein